MERGALNIEDFEVDAKSMEDELLWCEGEDKNTPIPRGARIKIGYVWGFPRKPEENGATTNPADLYILLKEDSTSFECWAKLVTAYEKTMEWMDAYPRKYFFEGLQREEDGTIKFLFGT